MPEKMMPNDEVALVPGTLSFKKKSWLSFPANSQCGLQIQKGDGFFSPYLLYFSAVWFVGGGGGC